MKQTYLCFCFVLYEANLLYFLVFFLLIYFLIVCQDNDLACKALRQDNDRPGFDALKLIHRQIDDDHNGNVDLSESDEFLRDELKYKDDFDRHNVFHRGDQHVSVEELWTTLEIFLPPAMEYHRRCVADDYDPIICLGFAPYRQPDILSGDQG
ncbi:putative stromal interaction molecule 1 [Apostichopus japonicus]|uniref:Putative stromal interaction molecule 1 n=1 Tax=Stichopus japonicus TaxID=307972 RepID=A0A2G8KCV0_STIJA|nr:putative stromal interaction molecule 1 [Apostichopus japonicus]